jgi:hypothetical protein
MNNNRRLKVKTWHEFDSENLFDYDITGLHKIVKPRKILSKKVRYLEPGLPQVPYMLGFIIEAFADLVLSQEERNKLDKNEIFLRVMEFVLETTKNLDSESEAKAQEAEQILGAAFGSQAAIDYLLPVLNQCYPDIDFKRCTNECFVECFNSLFADMFGSNTTE